MLYYINVKFDFGGQRMNKEIIKRVHSLYGIVVSIVTVIAGLCLMAACYGIYTSGDKPFSREAVAAAFSPIAFPVYLCLVLVVIGVLLNLFLPTDKEKTKPAQQYPVILERLYAKADLTRCDAATLSAIEAEQKSRSRNQTILVVLLIIWSVTFLVYALDPSHFHQSQINESMIRAVTRLLCCMGVPFCYAIYASKHRTASIKREVELLKQVPTKAKAASEAECSKDTTKPVNMARGIILGIAAVILVYGFISGGTADVLTKAINICTECVGLG